MGFRKQSKKILIIVVVQFVFILLFSQPGVPFTKWTTDGNSYYQVERESGEIVKIDLPSQNKSVFINKKQLTTKEGTIIVPRSFQLSANGKYALVYTNAKKVWRYPTRGDYWLLNFSSGQLKQMGKGRPASSLQFAKFSPDNKKVAYVSERNIYVEDLATGMIKKLTSDLGTKKLINGTFDWVYEEEFFCRDGFRWSPDSRSIAYWQIDANKIRDYYMLNTTDSVYSQVIPVEYPKVGEPPSPARIGVVNIVTAQSRWMNVPGDPAQHYIMRMEWSAPNEIILQQLNRKQNESKIILCNAVSGESKTIYSEKEEAWIATLNEWRSEVTGWDWITEGKEFIWFSEKNGWRHLYRISKDGKTETLITAGNYDVIDLLNIDEKKGLVYFYASPENATQKFLYRTKLDGSGPAERITPAGQEGVHSYEISPNGKFARHSFSNYYTAPLNEWVTLPDHKPFKPEEDISNKINPENKTKSAVSYFKITTEEGVTMDGWLVKPKNFDSTKKYPVVFYVYGEPAATTVNDSYGAAGNFLYTGDMAADGYVQVSLDNRGTPAPKGRAWRKSIYKKIGQVNIRDQALGAKEISKWNFIDSSRMAVWGWSGGGSSTLNLMFQYPGLFQTGISIAPVTSSLLYDNIYTERYMGLPKENAEDYKNGAALTHAKNLKGNLLFIHGTGDDNVHYQNVEMLTNELVKNGKMFQMMSYPNRTHSINEGEGTSRHLAALFTKYLKENCPPGGRTPAEINAAKSQKPFTPLP
ncbi:MAG TPA: S9 family peptidase [Chitinophagaceae bacterium]|nr:S9 family peptidase [Chitinophagaceae bacterium]